MEIRNKKRVREVIIVEGKYDKNTVAQAVSATIIETSGFGVFSDKEKLSLLRKLAEKRGLIILTDSDSAGFFIRGRLRGMIGTLNIKHAYIPDITGREKRKAADSKEGKLGVEGMSGDVIVAALERAGATFVCSGESQEKLNNTANQNNRDNCDNHDNQEANDNPEALEIQKSEHAQQELYCGHESQITKADMFELGLSGRPNSSSIRRELIKRLELPTRLSANGLLDVLNVLYTRDEFFEFFAKARTEKS